MTDDNKLFIFSKNTLLGIIGLVLIIVIIIPIPTLALDILIALSLLLALVPLIILLCTKKGSILSFYPTFLIYSTVFFLAVNLSAVRLILTQEAYFDRRIIRFISDLIFSFGGNVNLIIGIFIYTVIIGLLYIIIAKGATHTAAFACRLTLDCTQEKLAAIEKEYNSGAITEEEATTGKADAWRENDFYHKLDGAYKFISGYAKVSIFLTIVTIVIGIQVSVIYYEETAIDTLNVFIPLALGSGILFMLPALLQSIAVRVIITIKNKEIKII